MPIDPLDRRLSDIQGALDAANENRPLPPPLPDGDPPTDEARRNEIQLLMRMEAKKQQEVKFRQPGLRESLHNLGEGFKELPGELHDLARGFLEPRIPGIDKTVNELGEDLAFKLVEKVQGTPLQRAERLYGANIKAKIARRGPIQYDQGGKAKPTRPTGRKFR